MARIAILTTPEGHFSIAKAMEEALQQSHTTTFLSIRDSTLDLYTPIYQFFPSMYRVPYAVTKYSNVVSAIRRYLRQKLRRQVAQFVEESQPDLIVCTNWIFLPALEELHAKNHIPIINAITDPWTIHPLLISTTATSNLLFDEHVLEVCRKLNPKAKYDVTGWFVRKAFYEPTDVKATRSKLKIDNTKRTVVIAGGSEGTMMILKLIPALLQLENPINVIVMCGNNKQLLNSIRSFQKLIKTIVSQSLVIPIGFTSTVEEYLGVADLVIGKAGPNTIFETVAAKKPFIAITHIAGQEDGNLDLIKEYQLGFVEENAIRVVKLLQGVLKNPTRLTKLEPAIARLAAVNQAASKKLLAIVARSL